MKKRISLLSIIGLLLMGFMFAVGGCGKQEEDYLSRAEWIEMLAKRFGLDDYTTEYQYFSDVNEDQYYYAYVQSCADWGILNNEASKKFYPETDVQTDFAIETALLAAGTELGDGSAVDYAVAEGLLKNSGYATVKGRLTTQKAQEILDWAANLYLNQPFEEYTNVILNEEIIDLSQKTAEVAVVGDGEFQISNTVEADIAAGDIILVPGTDSDLFGVARKVESIEVQEDGSYKVITSEPELGEVCQELEIAVVAVPRAEDVILAEGVEWADSTVSDMNATDKYYLQNLGKCGENADLRNTAKIEGVDLGFNVNFTTQKLSIMPEWDNFFGMGESVKIGGEFPYSSSSNYKPFEKTTSIPDQNLFGQDPYDNTADIEAFKRGNITLDELCNRLKETKQKKKNAEMVNKFTAGYEITGSLKIKNLYIQLETKMNKVLGIPVGIDSFSVEVNSSIEASLSVKGKLEDELTVAKVPVAVSPGVVVEVKISLYAKLNGEIAVKATIENNTKTEYYHGQTKKTTNQNSTLSGSASATLDVGPKLTATLQIFGLEVIDANVSTAIRFKAKVEIELNTNYEETTDAITIKRETHYKKGIDGYIPIVSVGIGNKKGTLAEKIKLSFSWEVVGEKSAYHFVIKEPIDDIIWEETQTLPKKTIEEDAEEVLQSEQNDDDDSVKDISSYLTIDKYYVSLELNGSNQLQITGLPQGYTEADLVWISDDTSVATVSNGHVVAVNSGVTIITVRTNDGMFEAFCTINVELPFESFEGLKEV